MPQRRAYQLPIGARHAPAVRGHSLRNSGVLIRDLEVATELEYWIDRNAPVFGPMTLLLRNSFVGQPQTCRAVSTTTSSLRFWSSSLMRLPTTSEEKPHWGLIAS